MSSQQTKSESTAIAISPSAIAKKHRARTPKVTRTIHPLKDSGYYRQVVINASQVIGRTSNVSAVDVRTEVIPGTTDVQISYLFHRKIDRGVKKSQKAEVSPEAPSVPATPCVEIESSDDEQ